MLFLIFPFNVSEKGIANNTATPTTEIYAENTQTADDRRETMQNTWIFASEIPSPFRIENKRTESSEQKVVVQTLASQETSRWIIKTEITDGEILDRIQVKFGDQTATALRIMACESNGNRYAVSPTSDYGLFQINQIHFPEIPGETIKEKIEWLFNPINNINYAHTLYSRRGNFNDWVCYTKGLYKY